jgi:ABC-type dipeptide/oligopeptide/nickel transport system permease component
VVTELQQRLPATATLALAAFAAELVLVVGLGVWAAAQAGRLADHGIRILALVLIAVPSFWLGLVLLWLFAVQLQWVTVAGPATPQRLALLPMVTMLGLSLTGLLTGAVIAETVFSWPGVGKYVTDSIAARDYPVVQGYVLFTTLVMVLGNLAVDLLYGAVDPRVRLGGGDSA